MNVFMYWTGEKPKLIGELIRLAGLHAGKCSLHLICHENIADYLDVPNEFYALSPSYQSDYIRYNVIERFGGVWLDADTIVMQALDRLFEFFGKDGFLVEIKGALHMYGENVILIPNARTIYTGMFGSAPKTPFISEMAKRMRQAIATPAAGRPVFLMPKGVRHPIDDLLRTEMLAGYRILDGADSVFPCPWRECADQFLSKPFEHHASLIRQFQPVVCLVKSVYQGAEKIWPAIDTTPLSYFLRKSADNACLRV